MAYFYPRYNCVYSPSQLALTFHNEASGQFNCCCLFFLFVFVVQRDFMAQFKMKIFGCLSYLHIQLRTRFNFRAIRILCRWSNWCTKLRLRSDVRGEMGAIEAAAAAALAAFICGKRRERDRERLLALGRGAAAAAGCRCIIVKRSFNDNTVDPFKWTFPIDDMFLTDGAIHWITRLLSIRFYNLFIHLYYAVVFGAATAAAVIYYYYFSLLQLFYSNVELFWFSFGFFSAFRQLVK